MSTTTTEDGGGEQDFFDAELGVDSEGSDSGGGQCEAIDMAALATAFRATVIGDATFGGRSEQRRDTASTPTPAHECARKTPPTPHGDDSQKARRTASTQRSSLPEPIEPVPPIPARFLGPHAQPRHCAQLHSAGDRAATATAHHTTTPAGTAATPSATAAGGNLLVRPRVAAAGERARAPPTRLHLAREPAGSSPNYELVTGSLASSSKSAPASPTRAARPTTKPAAPPTVVKMMRFDNLRQKRDEDLFLELADEQRSPGDDSIAQLRRSMSRTSYNSKRRSLPADMVADRPSTSGSIYTRAPSRLDSLRTSFDMPRYSEPQRHPATRAASHFDDSASVISGRSQAGRARRFSVLPDRSPLSPSRHPRRDREFTESPELSHYQRRRLSFATAPSEPDTQQSDAHIYTKALDYQASSPADSSDRQQTDSSVESQTADTVWDELDELKSRIRNLESHGKKPPTSNATASGDSSDRPRTATTAPTTIDSSPNQQRKTANIPKEESTTTTTTTPPPDNVVGGPTAANVHPLLHDALTKAKGLLNSTVYRTLEASVADALQLAATTGNGGPQGTNFTAASITNGVTVNDRGARRKADNLCRNLTDLCLALCESKHEAPHVVSSPNPADTTVAVLPLRQSRSTSLALGTTQPPRPVSRLDARRSSLLGSLSRNDCEAISPRGSFCDISTSEADPTPTHSNALPPRRLSAAPSRLLRGRMASQGDFGGEEESRFRPPSRAMTDSGGLRVKSRISGEDRSPGAQRRTPSLRESLVAKRSNEGGYDGNREMSRMSSYGTDPRRRRPAPVLEEEDGILDYQQRRVTYSSRRPATDVPSRTSSLNQRRQIFAE